MYVKKPDEIAKWGGGRPYQYLYPLSQYTGRWRATTVPYLPIHEVGKLLDSIRQVEPGEAGHQPAQPAGQPAG